jgi:hypothetical protein
MSSNQGPENLEKLREDARTAVLRVRAALERIEFLMLLAPAPTRDESTNVSEGPCKNEQDACGEGPALEE